MIASLVVTIALLIGLFVCSPFIERRLICLILKSRVKRRSEHVRKLEIELFNLGQVREHWSRLDTELSLLDDAGLREWLALMQAEGAELRKGAENA